MEKSKAPQEDKLEGDKLEDYSYTTVQLGIWRLLLPIESAASRLVPKFSLSWSGWEEIKSTLLLLWRFTREIYMLNPTLNLIFFVLKLGAGIEGTLMLYASGLLLRTVETGLISGHPDSNAIMRAVALRVICGVFSSTLQWSIHHVSPILQRQVTMHFEDYMMKERLRLDLPTSADKTTVSAPHVFYIWRNFQFLVGVFERMFRLIAQITFTIQQPSGGITLTLLSLVSPILSTGFLRKNPWKGSFVYYVSNLDYLRVGALNMFASEEYREEIIAGHLGSWVVREYERARKALGKISDANPYSLYATQATPIPNIVTNLSGDLPTFYWAASALFDPRAFSITSFAILQQHAQALRFTVSILFSEVSGIQDCVTMTRDLYKMAEVKNKIVDGDRPYPNSTSSDKGMEFELRNVSFTYPSGTSKENTIRNLSCKISAGHLVVIVGPNGSGKSSLIKLLNRLYDVDSGEILVDGIPITEYRLADLHRAQALLTQDHKLYPLTLAENINDMEMVEKAAEAGGADQVISKLKDGFDTKLDPIQTAYGSAKGHKKLESILENLEKKADVSGGEKQRIVAARTFMRFSSGNIRFAVADEPSSALDPKAEHKLFQRLRESGGGKTMIFVTHRFGHLTKYANLIICMKDGEAVETGTHQELMARGGEYSELYNVQAQAFADSAL
ncbi:P-loop containing nucleoside triphosphate hydrolase protein [Mycena metata]|uniref:P-loop containing nucleoside triphosphate hydrolase protein n=1 Tax=Mycena metata TaxID=1033252 RepID=A0AAD7M8N0_9AGAR|nr:P-loop containing nucleoside triphosphate hydrolase protein [Mycena metata]